MGTSIIISSWKLSKISLVVACSALAYACASPTAPSDLAVTESTEQSDPQPSLPLDAENGFLLSRALYQIKAGHTSQAVDGYLEYHRRTLEHDFDSIHQMAFALLEKGSQSNDPDDQLRSVFGAGIAANTQVIPFLEYGLSSTSSQTQLASITILAQLHDDNADALLVKALNTPSLLTRLEAAYHLAAKKQQGEQIESLMMKIDSIFRPLFPKLFAMIGNPRSISVLQHLLADPDINVRIEAILSAMEFQRDDLLPQIRLLAAQQNIAQQEACAVAFGVLKDKHATEKLWRLSYSTASNVRLASLRALYQLGHHNVHRDIEKMAQEGNLFAISALGEIEESLPVLYDLVNSDDLNVQVNTSIALLEQHDPNSLIGLRNILIKDARDLAFQPQWTYGKGTMIWKVVPSARENLQGSPIAHEISLKMREEMLRQSINLPDGDFLDIAQAIFNSGQTDLIPSLVELLSGLRTPDAIELLKVQQQKVGSPLTRDYCNLALFRLREGGPYGDNVKAWLQHYQDAALINFRTMIPWKMRFSKSHYSLTPVEQSRLLIETYAALAESHDEDSIETLLIALSQANPKNQFALAGLLIRATE